MGSGRFVSGPMSTLHREEHAMSRLIRLPVLAFAVLELLALGAAREAAAENGGAETFTDRFEVDACFPFFPSNETVCVNQEGVVHVTETPNGQITTTVNGRFCFTLTAADGTRIAEGCTRSHNHERLERLGPSFFRLVMDHRIVKQESTVGELHCEAQLLFHYANGEVRVDETRIDCA
jgi:hypothetical protein